MTGEPLFERKNFYGTLILKEFIEGFDGNVYRQLMGKVSILTDEEIAGFKAGAQESPWVARVEGPTQAYVILGCQIRGVAVHPPLEPLGRACLVVP